MIYLLDSKLPETKSIYFALQHVYGIGKSKSLVICKKLGFSYNFKVTNLSSGQINQILKLIDVLPAHLKRVNLLRKQHFINIKSYRGLRRKKGFPVRGQRTHTNAKTAKKRL